jgi:hypothetical protein
VQARPARCPASTASSNSRRHHGVVRWSQLLRGAPRGQGFSSPRRPRGDDQGRRLWRILASSGIVEARNAQTRRFSLFSAFCHCGPPRCRQRWIPIWTPMEVFVILEPLRFAPSATIPPSPSPDEPLFEPGPRGEQFLIVNHTANQHNRSEILKIRFHGGQRRQIDNGSNNRFWRCSHPERNQLTEDIIET